MINVVGLPAVLAGLNAKVAEIDKAAGEGLLLAGERIKEAWVSNIESEGLVLTGHYRDSITVTPDEAQVLVHTDVPYSVILEHGNSRQDAHYPATRAFDENQGEATDDVGEAVSGVIR